MILEFKVKNFLSIKEEQTLSFEATADKTLEEHFIVHKGKKRLLKMALLYGANASGKTNVLMALDFVKRTALSHLTDKEAGTAFVPFLLDTGTKNSKGVFDLSFYVGDTLHLYHFEINGKFIENEALYYYPGVKRALIYSRKHNTEKDIAEVEFGSTVKVKPADKQLIQGNTMKNISVIAAFSKLNMEFPELDKVYHYFLDKLMPLVLPKTDLRNRAGTRAGLFNDTKTFILDMLNNADFNISGIDIETENVDQVVGIVDGESDMSIHKKKKLLFENVTRLKKLRFKHTTSAGEEMELPPELESSGTNRFFGLSGLLYETLKEGNVLSIDEIENSLHPDLVLHFMNTFLVNAKEAQLVCTTHNLDILSEQDNLRRDVVWFTDKDPQGATELYSLADFGHRKELSFINAYKAGKFGAKPKLGSIYLKNI